MTAINPDLSNLTPEDDRHLWYALPTKFSNRMTVSGELRRADYSISLSKAALDALLADWEGRGIVKVTTAANGYQRWRANGRYVPRGESFKRTRAADLLKGDDRYFTATETLRRLRAAAALARAVDRDIPAKGLTEVGLRIDPVAATGEAPTLANAYGEGDDLDRWLPMPEASKTEQVRRKGYVAHIYFSNDVELVNTVTVWLGDDHHEPTLISVPGYQLPA